MSSQTAQIIKGLPVFKISSYQKFTWVQNPQVIEFLHEFKILKLSKFNIFKMTKNLHEFKLLHEFKILKLSKFNIFKMTKNLHEFKLLHYSKNSTFQFLNSLCNHLTGISLKTTNAFCISPASTNQQLSGATINATKSAAAS
jgi:hypothetical protein